MQCHLGADEKTAAVVRCSIVQAAYSVIIALRYSINQASCLQSHLWSNSRNHCIAVQHQSDVTGPLLGHSEPFGRGLHM